MMHIDKNYLLYELSCCGQLVIFLLMGTCLDAQLKDILHVLYVGKIHSPVDLRMGRKMCTCAIGDISQNLTFFHTVNLESDWQREKRLLNEQIVKMKATIHDLLKSSPKARHSNVCSNRFGLQDVSNETNNKTDPIFEKQKNEVCTLKELN